MYLHAEVVRQTPLRFTKLRARKLKRGLAPLKSVARQKPGRIEGSMNIPVEGLSGNGFQRSAKVSRPFGHA
ncbi:hypothetical protein QO002_002761 [Pararhizobium capsulatum DSM 1112]|uniref:Transposase n=1 Tax=Pararhizobium capsulatum DSM 1112 TaxID=1121113 RepID=A0ABU0BQV6_9HYPH|nr:hypothetical protein [Pararhizobium capsulatum DSM 1112]